MATKRNLSLEDTNLNSTSLFATRKKTYQDIDLTFSAKPSSGEIYKKIDAAAVKQSVKTLLLTNTLEKPFDPYFGANLRGILFELVDENNEPEIERNIRNVIEVYEPRAEIPENGIQIDLSPDQNSVNVTVLFRIVNTGEEVEFTTSLNRLR